MFYSSIAAECLRICRATSDHGHAAASINAVASRMVNQGAEINRMKGTVTKMLNRHRIREKFGVLNNAFVRKLFV